MDTPEHMRTWIPWLMVGVLLLSAGLVWHDLGQREVLGRDENLSIAHVEQPDLAATMQGAYVKATGQPGNMQPLYFILQHLSWPLVGRSAFVLRFLPSVFIVLAVAMTYKLGEELFSPEAGLVGALLTALLPLHIRYAQVARPYAQLALFSVASAFFLVRALRTDWLRHWFGFILTATLNFYSHFNSLFVLLTEGLFAGALWLATLLDLLKKRESPRHLLTPAVAFFLLGLLCLPGLLRLSQLPWVGSEGMVRVDLTYAFFQRLMHHSGLTTPLLRGVIMALMAIGLSATLYRRRWWVALFIVLWLAVPFLILSVMKSPRPFAERYVIFVPPVALLLAGEGVVTLGQLAGKVTQRWNVPLVREIIIAALTIGLVLLFAAPLQAYYAANRAEDRLDQTLEVVERHAQADDLIIVSPRFFVRPLDVHGAEVLYLTEHLTASEFDALLSRYGRTWILYTSYLPPAELQEPMDPWIQARPDEFVRVPIKAITALALYHRTPADAEALLQDRIAVLRDLAEVSADEQEAWLRHGALADAYEALAELYARQGESALAEEYRTKAEETRAAAPRPW